MNARWHSFRLTTHDSGRVRWCIGNEIHFKKKLQILTLIPLALLLIIATYLLITHFAFTKTNDTDSTDFGRTYRFDNGAVTILPVTVLNDNFKQFDDTDYIDNTQDMIKTTFDTEPTIMALNYYKRNKRETNDEDIAINVDLKDNPELDIQIYDRTVKEMNGNGTNSFWNENIQPGEIRKIQAQTMQSNMDFSADPCVDFYQYACGNWGKNNPIPADRSGFDTFESLRQSLDTVLKDLLEDKTLKENTSTDYIDEPKIDFNAKKLTKHLHFELDNETEITDITTKAKHLYRSCMDEETIRFRGAQPLLDLVNQLGGWPVLIKDWNETNFDLVGTLGELRLYNNDILISEWVGPDIKNSKEYVIQIDQTTLGLPTRDYYLEPMNAKYIEAYRMFIVTIANLMGADMYEASIDATDIVNFETELAKIIVPSEHRRNVTHIYKKITIGELQLSFPQLDFLRFINIVFGRHVKETEPTVCFCWNYLHKLIRLLSRTPPRTIANYILWRFIRHRVNNLDESFEQAKQRFYRTLFGREKSPPRWQTCIGQVNSNLGMALGRMFVEKYFDEMSKNDTISMTNSLQTSFKALLINTSWLDTNTIHLSESKIDAMTLKIGYPDYLLNITGLNYRYRNISIHPDYYFENTLIVLKRLTQIEQNRLGMAVNKVLWNTPPAVVNAYYSRNKNQIMFPAGILQPPFYHRFFPKCLNYGGIGVVIGHEITHGFDDKGRLFDRDGNLQKWWPEVTIMEFHKRAQCLIEQYNQYVVPEINLQVSGHNTQGENIADNGGVKQAFQAYQNWYENHPDTDETLPGVDLTRNQLFFLNFAQIWCGNIRPEAAKNKLKTAVHSPGRFRVIGALSNSEEFAEAYKCPEGSPMNPQLKCKIW